MHSHYVFAFFRICIYSNTVALTLGSFHLILLSNNFLDPLLIQIKNINTGCLFPGKIWKIFWIFQGFLLYLENQGIIMEFYWKSHAENFLKNSDYFALML